jgi:hypothetical protein
MGMKQRVLAWCVLGSLTFTTLAAAQAALPAAPQDPDGGAPLPAPPEAAASYSPEELDRIVSPIALYPDPLLGQVLTAATFSPEIPDAAGWADQHHYVAPALLPEAIASDQLPWQPSVQALLPFPQILGMMASDLPWTEEVGAAFLASPDDVMDAVQRQRQAAYRYGYLRSNAQVVVRSGPFIEIAPVDPSIIVMPYYNPAVVFVAPRRGVVVGAVRFGTGVHLGVGFAPWGWGTTRFAWGQHVLFVNNSPWHRTWATRAVYVHPYAGVPRYRAAVVVRSSDHHELRERTVHEREAERDGHRHVEEHKDTHQPAHKDDHKDDRKHDDHDRDHRKHDPQ